jgi:hypothetical protein
VYETACAVWWVQERREAEQTYGSACRSASPVGYVCTAAPSSSTQPRMIALRLRPVPPSLSSGTQSARRNTTLGRQPERMSRSRRR